MTAAVDQEGISDIMDVPSTAGMLFGIPKKKLSEQAYDRLLDLIITREIPAGSVLQERLLSTMLNVSRTPAREALYRLESQGLVSRSPGGVLIVKEISVRDLVEILHIRRVLESESVTLAIGRVPATELDEMAGTIRGLLEKNDPTVNEDWAIDDQFHGLIARYSGNAMLAKMIQNLRMKTRIFNMERVPERFVLGHQEHLAIIESFRHKDLEQARAQIEEHLDHVKESIIRKLSEI